MDKSNKKMKHLRKRKKTTLTWKRDSVKYVEKEENPNYINK